MKRENRRVAAMSWGAGDDIVGTSKATRAPHAGNIEINSPFRYLVCTFVKIEKISQLPDSSPMLLLGDQPSAPQTYIIAQNPAVLAQLMRENENRPINPSAYTTPATVFNTIACDIDATKTEQQPDIAAASASDASAMPLKTVILPASELLKLNPIIDDNDDNDSSNNQIHQLKEHSGLFYSGSHSNSSSAIITNLKTISSSLSPSSSTYADEHLASRKIPSFIERYTEQTTQLTQNLNSQQQPIHQVPCEIINPLMQQVHSIDPTYQKTVAPANIAAPLQQQLQHLIYSSGFSVHPNEQSTHLGNNSIIYASSGATFFNQNACQNVPYSPGLPPPSDATQKSRSLERNAPANMTYATRISSLDRIQNAAAQLKQTRSNSLTRQLSAGGEMPIVPAGMNPVGGYLKNARSASLERRICANYGGRTNSLERNNQQIIQPNMNMNTTTDRGGSLERNQSVGGTYNMMKGRGYRGGSLERNQQGLPMVNRSASLERNVQYQMYHDQFKLTPSPAEQQEPFQEEIYDFGGANVKSCASIALSKSISKGLIPPGTTLPAFQANCAVRPISPNPNYPAMNLKTSPCPGLPPAPNMHANMHINPLYGKTLVTSSSSPTPSSQPTIQQTNYPLNSIYTPMYPLWSINTTAQMINAHKIGQSTPQMIKVSIPLNVNNPSQNAMLQNSNNLMVSAPGNDEPVGLNAADPIVDDDGFVAQVSSRICF